MKNVLLYSNGESDAGFRMARRMAAVFEKSGWETALCEYPRKPYLAETDMLVTFGGDGTILHASRSAAEEGVPVLGINMGGKGFIAELEPEDTALIEKAAAGDFETESRMMIDIELDRGGMTIYRDFALNDAVIKGDNKVIEMSVSADGQQITRFTGDGTIIATPTGSTAYSMSAGGPIVEPSAKNIIITPICAHILEAKSFVLTANRVITLKIENKRDIPAYLSIDGGTHIPAQCGDIVRVSKSEKTTQLVRLSGKSFYHRLTAKLRSREN